MSRPILVGLVAILAIIAGVLAYQTYEREQQDKNSLQIEVGPQGVKVDPPG